MKFLHRLIDIFVPFLWRVEFAVLKRQYEEKRKR
jgi:hypothetical protein